MFSLSQRNYLIKDNNNLQPNNNPRTEHLTYTNRQEPDDPIIQEFLERRQRQGNQGIREN